MILFKIIVYVYLLAPIISLLTILFDKIIIKKQKKYLVEKYANIYVLLPALKEQKIVKETIDYFRSINYKGNIKYVIITSEKEEYEYRIKKTYLKTTNELTNEYLKKINDNRFMHIHYNEINGNKSSQLNYAISVIKKDIENIDETYISVFDFDSRPSKDTFEELNKVIQNKNNPDEIQQIPLEIRNYAEISNRSIIMTIYSLQHMVRSLAIEKIKFQLYTLFKINNPKYFMGACMHLKLTTLIDSGLFPIFVDDLTLGYRYSIYNKSTEYLYTSNYSLIPNDLGGFFGSSTLIFKGILTFASEIKKAKKHFLNKLFLSIEGITNLLEVCIIPYLFLIYYFYSIIFNEYNFLTLLVFLIPILWSLSSYIVLEIIGIKNDNKKKSILAIVLSGIWFIFRPTGFIIYTVKKIKSIIYKQEITYSKTPR